VLPKPERVGDKRRYSADAIQRLAVLHLAQACGFRLGEMRHLLHRFGAGVKAAIPLAGTSPLEATGAGCRDRASESNAASGGSCRCVELAECGRIAGSVLESE
jgi:DNA-binding transcriptional MerR regulator